MIDIPYWAFPFISFAIATLTSTGGLSGAFLILPIQVSLLGFTAPAVTPTNHLYNVVALPGGIYRFAKEKRLVWPITAVVILGTLPGVAAGSWIRVHWLADPSDFKLFIGSVLLLIGGRLFYETILLPFVKKISGTPPSPADSRPVTPIQIERFGLSVIDYSFSGQTYRAPVPALFLLALAVGLIGGAYGVGGGAIIAPFLIAFFRLPVYTIAGAALAGTFITSTFAVTIFSFFPSWLDAPPGMEITPNWTAGLLFGVGGLAGTYTGARIQRYLPASFIKGLLGVSLCAIALNYILDFVL